MGGDNLLNNDELQTRINNFKQDVKTLSADEIISKYYYNDFPPAALSLDLYHKLRLEIKTHFKLESIFNVFLVGSGRLGFSIKPQNEYREFNDDSDLDIVIVSKELFETYWNHMREYDQNLVYWKDASVFENTFYNGWMRPDKLPKNKSFVDPLNWWEYFEKLSASNLFGRIKIRGGLYYSLDALESYQKKAINKLKLKESLNNANDSN